MKRGPEEIEKELGQKLEDDLKEIGLHPDDPEFWEKYGITEIPGLRDISEGINIRKVDQEKSGLPGEWIGLWIYATNEKVYEEKLREGYELVALHPEYMIPCLFKPIKSEERTDEWFWSPEKRKRRKAKGYEWFLPPIEEKKDFDTDKWDGWFVPPKKEKDKENGG